MNGNMAHELNDGFVTWACDLTRGVVLRDDDKLKAARAGYPDFPNAQRPPFVLKGDTLTADRFWIGARMNDWAEQWVPYWTKGVGRFVTSAEEDAAYLQALTFLSRAGRVDLARALDLRTGSDFTVPPKGVPVRIFSRPKQQATMPAMRRRSRTPIAWAAPWCASWRSIGRATGRRYLRSGPELNSRPAAPQYRLPGRPPALLSPPASGPALAG